MLRVDLTTLDLSEDPEHPGIRLCGHPSAQFTCNYAAEAVTKQVSEDETLDKTRSHVREKRDLPIREEKQETNFIFGA